MMQDSRQAYAARARRTSREIILAVVLTLVALIFLVAAFSDRSHETADAGQRAGQSSQSAN